MVWQKIDDQFGISRKVIKIPKRQRLQCIGLWTLAGNYSVRALTNGVLEPHELAELDAPAAVVAELVRVELWHAHKHTCPACVPVPVGGAVIHDFLHYNPSREQVQKEREAERVRKASQRDKRRTPTGTPPGSDPVSGHPVPVPSQSRPVPMTDMTKEPESSHLSNARDADFDSESAAARAEGIHDLRAVAEVLSKATGQPVSARGARFLAAAIVSKSKREVRKVDAYVATTCRTSAAEVQQAYFDLDIGAYGEVAS